MRPRAGAVSVVIPTRDRADLVVRAVESVLAQTVPPGEILVVDDGSVDDTAPRLRRYEPRVRLLTQEGKGVSAARNRGILESRGSWIAFLDSDDEWCPPKLERQLEALARGEERLCHTGEIWIRRGNRVLPRRRHHKSGGWIFDRCVELCVISPSSVLLERALFDEVGLFDEELPACEDYDLWLRICSRHPVLYLDEELVIKYGGHADQLSRRHWGMDRFRIRALEKILAQSELTEEQRDLASGALRRKIEVFVAGARRRGRLEEVETYEEKLLRPGGRE